MTDIVWALYVFRECCNTTASSACAGIEFVSCAVKCSKEAYCMYIVPVLYNYRKVDDTIATTDPTVRQLNHISVVYRRSIYIFCYRQYRIHGINIDKIPVGFAMLNTCSVQKLEMSCLYCHTKGRQIYIFTRLNLW